MPAAEHDVVLDPDCPVRRESEQGYDVATLGVYVEHQP